MTTRRIVIALASAGLLAGALASTGSAHATAPSPRNAAIENAWQTGVVPAFPSDQCGWQSLMDAEGRGTIFCGGSYRDYDATTGELSASRTLARGDAYLTLDGIGRGHQCATWGGNFGVGMGCRTSTSTPWVKVNVSRSANARAIDVAIAADGRSAMIVWGTVTQRRATVYASRFTFATGRLTAAVALSNPAGRRLPLTTSVIASGSGFLVAFGTHGAQRGSVAHTYIQTTRDGRSWSDRSEVLLAPPGGTPAPVAFADLARDGAGAVALATSDVAGSDEPTSWMLASLQSADGFSAIDSLPEMTRPRLAVVGEMLTVVGAAPSTQDLLAYAPGTGDVATLTHPDLPEGSGRLGSFQVVGQTSTDGAPGFSVVADYYAYDDSDEQADRLYAATGFPTAAGIEVSGLTQIGNRASYEEGMGPRVSGFGRYALVAYSAETEVRFAFRSPGVI